MLSPPDPRAVVTALNYTYGRHALASVAAGLLMAGGRVMLSAGLLR
jgi:hypothetical protein